MNTIGRKSTSASATQKINKRIANIRRHTIGFVIGQKTYTRGEAVKMARAGKINGVTAKKGRHGWYVTSLPNSNINLYDLPTVIR